MPQRRSEDTPRKPSQDLDAAMRRSGSLSASGQYAAMALHDIHDPLEAIANLAYLIDQDAESPEDVRAQVRLLEEQRVIATEIIRRALGVYRSAKGKDHVDLTAVVEAALRVHRHKIAGKSLQLRKEVPQSAMITADAGEMLQVISNLIANALDALPTEGVLSIRVRRGRDCFRVLVADNGHGIPSPIVKKVFRPFFTTKGAQGTGLGLAISKTLLERNQGSIKLRSSVRNGRSGTIFRICLPTSIEKAA